MSPRHATIAIAIVSSLPCGGGARAGSTPSPLADRGLSLLLSKGCSGCHTFDGRPAAGPTFVGLWGKQVPVTSAGLRRRVAVDRAYVARSIRQPDADIVEGYRRGSMPALELSSEELDAVVAAVRFIGREGIQLPWSYFAWLFALIGAASCFVGGHLLLSMHPLRAGLIALLGRTGFQGLYSSVALGSFIAMVVAWTRAPLMPLWSAGPWARYVPLVGMPFALVLLVAGFSSPNPTTAGQERLLEHDVEPEGALKITRHPGLWAFALLGLLHLPPSGHVSTLVLFGSVTLLALLGMVHIDRRRKRDFGAAWERFASRTSVIPFAALARQKARLRPADVGWAKIAIALLIYGSVLLLHRYLFGVSALPSW